MPTPLDIQFGQSGTDVASIDKNGNLTVVGNATIGGYVALFPQSAPQQIPGQALLYTPDGSSLSLVNAAGADLVVSSPASVMTAPVTVTGTTAKTALFTGPTIAANALAAGQVWHLSAWGALTTTVDTQTVTLEVDYGTTSIFTFGAQEPNSGGTVTGGSWKFEADILVQSATSITASGWDGLNFFFSSLTQSTTTVVSTSAKALSLQVTNSANAVSVTCDGAYFERVA